MPSGFSHPVIYVAPNFDGFVKIRFYPVFVIHAKAGIQLNQKVLDSRLRGSDVLFDFLRVHQFYFVFPGMRGIRANYCIY